MVRDISSPAGPTSTTTQDPMHQGPATSGPPGVSAHQKGNRVRRQSNKPRVVDTLHKTSASEVETNGPGHKVTPHATLLAIAHDPRLAREFEDFLSNVLGQLDSQKFIALLKQTAAEHPGNYEAFYTRLQSRLGEAKHKGLGHLRAQLASLAVLKETLASQIGALTSSCANVNGYAEIGYPGRLIRPLQKHGASLTGSMAVIGEAESMTDYVEAGFPRPYQKFVSLNDYAPIDRQPGGLAANSLDMVVCPIGLHHAPADKLDAFFASIASVLRPGGSFMLREHDVSANDTKMAIMANAAHTVFNAATGVPFAQENTELRHFKSLAQWQTLADHHGFDLVGEPQMTEGDPSRNALMRFVKRPNNPAQACDAIERQMRMSVRDYQRPACQTHLTTMEWHLVHTAKEQAQFVAQKPPHKYPYLRHVGTLWRNFFGSLKEGIKASGIKGLPTEYVLMNLFMVVCTTGEHLWRRATLLPLYLLPQKATQNSEGARQLARTQKDYARFIEHTPFFNFPFIANLRKQWAAFFRGGLLRAPINLWLALTTTVEYGAKGIVSAPLALFYEDADFSKIHMLVDDPNNLAASVLQNDEIPEKVGIFSVVNTDRYLPFMDKVQSVIETGANIRSIAGQTKVQIKVRAPKAAGDIFSSVHKDAAVAGCRLLGIIPIHTGDQTAQYLRMEADVGSLREVFARLKSVPGAELTYIHDF